MDTHANEIAVLEAEIVFYRKHATDGVIELGKRLLRLLAVRGEAGFVADLWRLGIPHSEAKRWMSAAEQLAAPAAEPLLTLPYLSQTQLVELLELDADERTALAQGRRVRGLKYRDMRRMPSGLLREHLRSNRPSANGFLNTLTRWLGRPSEQQAQGAK